MLTPADNVWREALADGLVMTTVSDEADLERVAQFNGAIHGPGVAGMTRSLALHYPGVTGHDFFFIESSLSGEVVSSLCLLPWKISYAGEQLLVGEMGIVGTAESHRRRGLVRAQVGPFMQRLAERGFLLSLIQGIPHYYRQFGYQYALPLEGGICFTARDLPPAPDRPFRFRPATLADIPRLAHFYDEAGRELEICTVRDDETWRFLLERTAGTDMEAETLLIEDEEGCAIGYTRLPAEHFNDELRVSEVSKLGHDPSLALLHHTAALATERNLPGVQLSLPVACTPARLARSYRARELGTYAWQVHIPDLAPFLRAISPVLNRRLAQSPFDGLSHTLSLHFYRHSVALHFAEGRLQEVAEGGPGEGEINFPLDAFIPLLLGEHTLDELHAWYPDIGVAPRWRLLLETLFPKMPAFLYAPY